jgi:hypothetical protein
MYSYNMHISLNVSAEQFYQKLSKKFNFGFLTFSIGVFSVFNVLLVSIFHTSLQSMKCMDTGRSYFVDSILM